MTPLIAVPVLASADFSSPLLWAVVIGWILTVVIHELAHGIVAYLGGDYTIKERGGLTLNPLQYVDPFMSIILPVIFLLMGGIPLPGGVTYVRNDLLRSKAWISAVSLAGPASNFLIMILLLGSMHPALHLFDMSKPAGEWSDLQIFIATMAVLQGVAAMLNLIPCPPLDGFNAIAPYLPEDLVYKVRTPPLNFICFLGFYYLIARQPILWAKFYLVFSTVATTLGLGPLDVKRIFNAYNITFFGG